MRAALLAPPDAAFNLNGVQATTHMALRYDNEAGKGDHKHIGSEELPYRFVDMDQLLDDFWHDVETWRPGI